MNALLAERSKRRKEKDWAGEEERDTRTKSVTEGGDGSDIKRLVESVKRKSKGSNADGGVGKRRKFAS